MLAARSFSETSLPSPSAWPHHKGRSDARGQPLAALRSSSLRERFYCWRGVSGERYICSIFSLEDENVIGGFSNAVVIGVCGEGKCRRPLCLLSARDFLLSHGNEMRLEAKRLGVAEWHVHFGATEAELSDLAASLLN
jgi:hypothetical protein